MRILLAEDEPVTALQIGHQLERAGHQVSFAANGDAAWHLFQAARHEVVVTDVMMPVVDGAELVRRIRELAQSVPVIVISGTPQMARAIVAEHAGANIRWLEKPVHALDLRQAVAEALHGAQVQRSRGP